MEFWEGHRFRRVQFAEIAHTSTAEWLLRTKGEWKIGFWVYRD